MIHQKPVPPAKMIGEQQHRLIFLYRYFIIGEGLEIPRDYILNISAKET